MTVAVLGGWELSLRAMGHRPTTADGMGLWSYWRQQAYGDRVIVSIGGSRSQLAFVPDGVRASRPEYRVIQLSINGSQSPAAILRDLAMDERFRGVVLCDIGEIGFLERYRDAQQPYVEQAHQFGSNTAANVSLSSYLHQRLVMLHPMLKGDTLLIHLMSYKAVPAPFYVDTFPDRSRVAHYTMLDREELRRADWSGSALPTSGGRESRPATGWNRRWNWSGTCG